MPIFLTGRRSATTTLAQIHAYDLNLCTDLHCSRRTLTLAAPRSCAATSSTNALMGVCCHQPVRLPRANPHSARGTTACHFPRFRSLKAPVHAASSRSAGIRNPQHCIRNPQHSRSGPTSGRPANVCYASDRYRSGKPQNPTRRAQKAKLRVCKNSPIVQT
jgi:hypothetical protein